MLRAIPNNRAIARSVAPHSCLRRRISRTRCIDTLSAGIAPLARHGHDEQQEPPRPAVERSPPRGWPASFRDQWPACSGESAAGRRALECHCHDGNRSRRGPQERADDGELAGAIRTLVDVRPTYGYRRIAALLKGERRSEARPRSVRAAGAGQLWSLYFPKETGLEFCVSILCLPKRWHTGDILIGRLQSLAKINLTLTPAFQA